MRVGRFLSFNTDGTDADIETKKPKLMPRPHSRCVHGYGRIDMGLDSATAHLHRVRQRPLAAFLPLGFVPFDQVATEGQLLECCCLYCWQA